MTAGTAAAILTASGNERMLANTRHLQTPADNSLILAPRSPGNNVSVARDTVRLLDAFS